MVVIDWVGQISCGGDGSKGDHGEAERRFGICGDGKRRQRMIL
jgi:hypothetical protein